MLGWRIARSLQADVQFRNEFPPLLHLACDPGLRLVRRMLGRSEDMEIQQQISAELNRNKIGKTFKVIIDRKEDGYYVGRTEFDSPEVDGEVLVSSLSELKKGAFYEVKITGAEDYDLFGEDRTYRGAGSPRYIIFAG